MAPRERREGGSILERYCTDKHNHAQSRDYRLTMRAEPSLLLVETRTTYSSHLHKGPYMLTCLKYLNKINSVDTAEAVAH